MADSNAKAQALAQEQAQALAQDQEKMQAQEQTQAQAQEQAQTQALAQDREKTQAQEQTQAQAQEQAQAQGKDQDQVREQAQVWDQAQNQVQEETQTQAQEQAQAESRAEPKSKRSKRRKRIGIVVGVIIVVFFVASFFFDRALLGQTYARYDIREPNLLMTFDDYEGVYERAPVSFQMGDSTLRGYIYGPDNTRGLIIFRHGIFSQQQDYLPLITALVDRGWRVFAYDAIGCGESDGDSTIGMSQSMRDVAAAVAFVQESGMADGMKVGLWGHSWGGYGVAAALGRIEGVDACVTMSGFDSPMKILVAAAKQMVGPLAVTQIPTMWLNTVLTFGGDADVSASQAVAESGVPTLVIHGSGDATVPYDDVSILDNVQRSDGVPQNVTAKTFDEPGRNGHNDYFYSRESQQYLNECADELSQLLDAADGNVDAPEVQAYVASMDKRRANTADPELIDGVDAFFAQHLESTGR